MSTHEQHYLTCDGCSKVYENDAGEIVKGETADCVRGDAIDDNWTCYQGPYCEDDFCPSCKL